VFQERRIFLLYLGNSFCMVFFFLICIVGGGVQTGSTRHIGHLLAYCTCPGWLWGWRIWWNEWQGKPKYSEKTSPDATLSPTNPTWPDPGLNPDRRGGKPATNRFSYGAASCMALVQYLSLFVSKSGISRVVWVTPCRKWHAKLLVGGSVSIAVTYRRRQRTNERMNERTEVSTRD
jgi:hypothetical protein